VLTHNKKPLDEVLSKAVACALALPTVTTRTSRNRLDLSLDRDGNFFSMESPTKNQLT
jgi:hypothetical protein